MLRLAFVFLVIALISGLLCIGIVADYSWATKRIVFFVFLVFTVLSLLGGSNRRRYYY